MNLSIVDAIIILFILVGGIVGYKNGAIQEGIKLIGIILVVIISFLFKDTLMVMLYENLPFFNFLGEVKGLDAMNVLFYQLVSFIIIFIALMFLLRILIVITGFIEWLLKITVFLKIPSKILGIFVGMVEFYIYAFVILYIFNMPFFNLTYINNSNVSNEILNNTPILSNYVAPTVDVYRNVWEIVKNREDKPKEEVNTLVLATLLDNKLITVESAKKLVDANKIIINDKSILDKYTDEGSFYEELIDTYKYYS